MFYLDSQLLQGDLPASFTSSDYSLDHHYHQQQQLLKQASPDFCSASSLDKLSFADEMQFADFGPKLALNHTNTSDEENGIDPVYLLKFPVLSEKFQDRSLMIPPPAHIESKATVVEEEGREEEGQVSENILVQLQIHGGNRKKKSSSRASKNQRKRPRTIKTSEEVQSQRMTHIAVERNRRKQMNDHIRVLRSLMPGSYVQRGDQASIIGGAIEFVRELEQLLQCLESQKQRKIYGSNEPHPSFFTPMSLPNDQFELSDFNTGVLHEETAENKSCLADVEVKLLGFDVMIKILSRRRPGQLLKIIAALEDLQLNILHTNITAIEQTVLYSFNVKVSSESRFTAGDIASSIQQIFIHASSTTNTI